MTYTQILTDAWDRADDTVRPYKWNDTDWISYLNYCLDELCIQTQLLVDSTDTDFCSITVASSTARYSLNAKVVNVLDVWDNTTGYPLELATVGQMNAYDTGWRSATGTPTKYILDDTIDKIMLYPIPTASNTIKLRVVRLVKEPPTSDTLSDSPDFSSRYHRFLVDGILLQAYMKNDAETRDPDKIALYQSRWENAKNTIYQASKRFHMSERVISPPQGFL